jgi:tRNA pseudouridine55 synthase
VNGSRARSGILVVDKPPGLTSFGVVAAVRRVLGVRRVGHAGTLDPGATGVLPVLIGEATKLMPFLMDQDKEYVTTVRFGVTTDTLDAGGRVLSSAAVPPLSPEALDRICRAFVGPIRQVPPMYSAVHHEGRRLHELARAGLEVDRQAREVVVLSIAVEAVESPLARLRVACGKGTYVRVLAADIGARLGCGAVVETLVRTRVGPFTLEQAISWDLLGGSPGDALRARVEPPEAALAGWPVVRLGTAAATAFRHGQAVDVPGTPGQLVRVERADDLVFMGVGAVLEGGRRVRPVRILHADHPGPRVLPA